MSLLCAVLKIVQSFNDFMLDVFPSRSRTTPAPLPQITPSPKAETATSNQIKLQS